MIRSHLRDVRAFTLIELLVVILIIGILVAVAAPTFLGQSNKANDSAAQQMAVVASREAKADYTSAGQSFSSYTPTTLVGALKASEPQYAFYAILNGLPNPSPQAGTIDVALPTSADSAQVELCSPSRSGLFFCLLADEAAGLSVNADGCSSSEVQFSGARRLAIGVA